MTDDPAMPPARRPSAHGVQALLVVVVGLLLLEVVLPFGVLWNRSASLPRGLYTFVRGDRPLARGALACAPYRAPAWARDRHYFPEGALLCKEVLGLPGDRIAIDADQRVRVCTPDGSACRDGGIRRFADSQGRPVPVVLEPGPVPDGFVYLGATRRPNSFDSRYLGVVPRSELTRVIRPLWVEKD